MVWFQCEDCGENLKKPKLQNHFRMCSASKLSCIDCGEMFNKQSVQNHSQCMTEAEKYGPKGLGKTSNATPAKAKKESKLNSDINVNVGLSSRAPWFCSLCNTHTTSQQTLLLHADGKKHRSKARGFHSKQQASQLQEPTLDENNCNNNSVGESVEATSLKTNSSAERIQQKASCPEAENRCLPVKKRKFDAAGGLDTESAKGCSAANLGDGEVIQSETKTESLPKRSKHNDAESPSPDHINEICNGQGANNKNVKWKKMISSILKTKSADGVMKIKKLRKLVSKALEESGVIIEKAQLKEKLEHKINSSSQLVLDDELVRLAPKSSK